MTDVLQRFWQNQDQLWPFLDCHLSKTNTGVTRQKHTHLIPAGHDDVRSVRCDECVPLESGPSGGAEEMLVLIHAEISIQQSLPAHTHTHTRHALLIHTLVTLC